MDEKGSREGDPQPPEGGSPSDEQARPRPEDTDTNEGARTKGEGEGDGEGEAGQRGGEGDTEDQQPPDSTNNQVSGEQAAASEAERGGERQDTPVQEQTVKEEEGEAGGSGEESSSKEPRDSGSDEAKTSTEEGEGEREGEEAKAAKEESEGGEGEEKSGEEKEVKTVGKEEGGEEGVGAQHPVTQQSSSSAVSVSSQQKEERKREKERRKAEKKSRKKSKQSHDEDPGSPPKLRKRTGQADDGGSQMETILLSMFQPFDPDGSSYVDPTVFWEVLQSSELNLQLEPQEVASLHQLVTPDRSGLISYAEFAAQAKDIIASLYQDRPPSAGLRINMTTPSGKRILSYDKQTGHFQDPVEEGVDPFAENIQNLFQTADTETKGYVTRDEFITLFQLEQLQYLTEVDRSQMLQYFDEAVPDGKAQYTDFYTLGKELILRLYRNQDTSGSEWLELRSTQLGQFQFNKFTGEVQRVLTGAVPTDATQPQLEMVHQAYRQVEEVTFELEQYKQENRELQNQLALGQEAQETLATQLDETGHILDEANAEIRQKEEEVGGLQAVLAGKEQEMEELRTQLAEAELVKEKLRLLEQELESAQGEVEERDQTMVDKESSIYTLKRQSHSIVDKLKTAWATVDARDSTIVRLRHQLKTGQGKLKTYEQQTPALEAKVGELEAEVKRLGQVLEEKTSVFSTTRKHLKHARERNMELEKGAEKAGATQERLRGAESEIHTLKSLLTSKTVMVERRKRELADTRARLLDLEEKDNRRSIILADVLEKTARQYQHELQMGGARGAEVMTFDPRQQLSLSTSQYTGPGVRRSLSAPSVPPDSSSPQPPYHHHHHTVTGTTVPGAHPHKVVKTYTLQSQGRKTAPTMTAHARTTGGRTARRGQARSHSVPKLPPIHRRSPAGARGKSSSFYVPTSNELREGQRRKDREVVQHSESNLHCTCLLCHSGGATRESMKEGASLSEQIALAGLSGSQENTLAQQLRTGQRVLVNMKRSQFDLEPQKCTGIVKYVGKIDSEFIDNHVYVGVKLDEPVGDSDGLVKGKRYFHCPARHGKMVRLTSVQAILPSKSVSYKPLQITKRSPYTTATSTSAQQRLKIT